MGKKIEGQIIEYFKNDLDVAADYFSAPDYSDRVLFTNGLVDSFGVLRLIAFLEETFGVTIDTNEQELKDFDTLNKIVALLAARGAKVGE